MRGGRKRVIGGAVIFRIGSGEALATVVSDGSRVGSTFGKPWNPQQEQMPLQLSGTTGWECRTVEYCAEAGAKDIPSQRSQWGGFTVSQNSKTQSNHAHERVSRFWLMLKR